MKPCETCETCLLFDGCYCTKDLNNLDYSLAREWMEKKPEDSCENYTPYEEEE